MGEIKCKNISCKFYREDDFCEQDIVIDHSLKGLLPPTRYNSEKAKAPTHLPQAMEILLCSFVDLNTGNPSPQTSHFHEQEETHFADFPLPKKVRCANFSLS